MKLQPTLRVLACAAVLVAASASQASEVTFQTRGSAASVGALTAEQVRDTVEALMAVAPGAGFCNATPTTWSGLSNQATCGSAVNSNIAYDITADFHVSASMAGAWSFRIGPDFGRGGALFIDGVAVDLDANDLWWNGSYGNPAELLLASVNLGAGQHRIEAYGFEPCCDGTQQAQFLAPDARAFVTFGRGDGLDPLPVPAPAGALLALTGLALLPRRRTARG